jgi:hypothetical protein
MNEEGETIKIILEDIITNIETTTTTTENQCDDNIEILKLKLKTLENKNKLLINENYNLNKFYQDYKIDREVKYEKVIKILNEKLNEKEKELVNFEQKLNENELQKQQQIDQLHFDFKNKFDQAFKKFQESQKDKTSMIMKYAEAEKKCIELNRTIDHLQTRLNDFVKEKQRLMEKLDAKNVEKTKFNADFEAKLNEITILSKQIEKLKEINVLNEVKLNKFESKYKNECEINIENRKLIETLNNQLVKIKNSINSEQNIDLNHDIDNVNDCIENIEHVTSLNNDSQKFSRLSRELNAKNKSLNDEVNQMKVKLSSFDNENKANMITIQNYKETLNNQKQMNKDLLSEILQLRELQVTLTK